MVFLDVSKEKNNFEKVLRYSIILSFVGLFAVFILVWFFSKKVFRPVEESDRKQKRFITDASHELKTAHHYFRQCGSFGDGVRREANGAKALRIR